MPRLWNETIETHRRDVTESILATTASLAAEHGVRNVTMSQIAEQVGIGRATLYKYFPNVETILLAWQHRQIVGHLAELSELAGGPAPAIDRLSAVLRRYTRIAHEGHDTELGAALHRGDHLQAAQDQLHELVARLIAEAAAEGSIRGDVAAGELATFCLHALGAARDLRATTARDRLVSVVVDALSPRD